MISYNSQAKSIRTGWAVRSNSIEVKGDELRKEVTGDLRVGQWAEATL